MGAILPAGGADQDVLTFDIGTTTWIAQAPIAFTAIPLAGTVAAITGDLEFISGISLFRATSSITLNTNDITIAGDNFDVTSTDSLISAETTFDKNIIVQESAVVPAAPVANSFIIYADDRAAVAGSMALNILIEDGTEHIIGDIVGIGTLLPDVSSMLDVRSTTKGFLQPRMSTAQRLAIPAPAAGLTVFDNSLSQFFGFNGTDWVLLG